MSNTPTHAETARAQTPTTLSEYIESLRDENSGLHIALDATNAMLAFATQQHEKQENALVSYQLELAQVRAELTAAHAQGWDAALDKLDGKFSGLIDILDNPSLTASRQLVSCVEMIRALKGGSQ